VLRRTKRPNVLVRQEPDQFVSVVPENLKELVIENILIGLNDKATILDRYCRTDALKHGKDPGGVHSSTRRRPPEEGGEMSSPA